MEVVEIVRFLDKDDNEKKIFPIPSMRARELSSFWRENVIAVVMLLSLSVVMAKICYQMLEIV